MTSRSKFRIPTIDDMEKADSDQPKIQSLFTTHQASVKSNIQNAVKSTTSVPANNSVTETELRSGTKDQEKSLDTGQRSIIQSPTESQTSSIIKPVVPKADDSSEKSSLGRKKTNSLLVSTRQRGNPILKYIRNVSWEYEDIIADYQMGQTSCALFLSLRYHQLNPNYIHERLKQLGHSYNLRVLLTLIDIKDPHHCLKELAKMCILADCSLILAFSQDEAGRYLETYKAYENKPPDLIMEKTEGNHMARITDCLTKVRRVNKTDAMTLMSAFGSFKNIVQSSEEDLSLCPGFGPQKALRLHNAFHEPFLKSKKKSTLSKQSDKITGNSAKGSPQKKSKTDVS